MKKTDFFTLNFDSDNLIFLDQTKLPLAEEYVSTSEYERIAEAIERLEIRGAPAIGVAAAYALALSLKNIAADYECHFEKAYNRLASTRPTAVNLFWALNSVRDEFNMIADKSDAYPALIKKAREIRLDDEEKCRKMAENGLGIFEKKSRVLTHCNSGRLATAGIGTALGVIINAYKKGLVEHVYADETRPLLQGLRLTAFELEKLGIPFTLQVDSAAAVLMSQNKIDLVITGADRIASNGDAANKIGTYNLAVLCKHHSIPFYIAAPTSTIDRSIASGNEIKIELRSTEEVVKIGGSFITKPEYNVFTPAFDVTPAGLIAGIITEERLHKPPYGF
jgi:methylthioribose-1-phosphate isomerase